MPDRPLDALVYLARRRAAADAQQRAHVLVAAQQFQELRGGKARILDLQIGILAVARQILAERRDAAAGAAVVEELPELGEALAFGHDDAVEAERLGREHDLDHAPAERPQALAQGKALHRAL